MFEEYLKDANNFLERANEAADGSKPSEARSFYRASIFYAASSLEAFVNFIADTFAKGNSLTPHEIAFLNDKNLMFSVDKGLAEKAEFHRLEDKIRLLMKKFVPGFDFKNASWSQFMQFKDFRDKLVHPRQSEDQTTLTEYKRRSEEGLSAIITIMNYLSKGIFKRPLRQQLLDLIPD